MESVLWFVYGLGAASYKVRDRSGFRDSGSVSYDRDKRISSVVFPDTIVPWLYFKGLDEKKAETKQEEDGILSNEDFKRIKQLKMKKEAMSGQGLKIPDSEQLRMKRVDPMELEAHIKLKLTKEQRLELVKAGREDRGKYKAKTAIKQKKKGGLSNRQKKDKKSMPLAAKRSKVAKSKQANKRKQSKSQFRGRKAWK